MSDFKVVMSDSFLPNGALGSRKIYDSRPELRTSYA